MFGFGTDQLFVQFILYVVAGVGIFFFFRWIFTLNKQGAYKNLIMVVIAVILFVVLGIALNAFDLEEIKNWRK